MLMLSPLVKCYELEELEELDEEFPPSTLNEKSFRLSWRLKSKVVLPF